MNIVDFYTCKGFYKIGENITFKVKADESQSIDAVVTIYDLDNQLTKKQYTNLEVDEDNIALITLNIENMTYGGYIAEITDNNGNSKRTAFDILDHWTDFPRYGYVSFFQPEHKQVNQQIEDMAKYHINGVQFYDWQYRHDSLLSKTTRYLDPFKREMSLDTVNEWINACHKHQMAAMPYLAIYAASVEFWDEHQSWGMFDEKGDPLMFEDFLGLVDPTYNSQWFHHLSAECDNVLKNTQFDGLHIDQYGEPKKAYNAEGIEIDIPKAFVDFINHCQDKNKGTVVFNAVGNWPIEELTQSNADFMYIEVWEYTPTFQELKDIVANARIKSGQKPVVIPIYIKEKDFNNVLLADAIINATGGTHLEIGDGEKLLSDPYFPKAEHITRDQLNKLRKYWDFVVAYQTVLGPKATLCELDVSCKEDIMIITRENEKFMAINFVNCSPTDKWIEHMDEPTMINDMQVSISVESKVKQVMYGSPDDENWTLAPLDYECDNKKIDISIPKVHYWSMVLIELQ